MATNTVNFAACFEYLTALETHRKEVLIWLRQYGLPVYVKYLESRGERTAVQTLPAMLQALKRGASEELEQLAHAVRTWAEEFGFQDAWLQDVALQTMHSWDQGKRESNWTYFPDEPLTPKFLVDFGHWFPVPGYEGYVAWPVYKQLADARYRRERAAYRARVRKLWGLGSPSLSQHAVWAVLYQRGKSPEWIQREHLRTTGQTVSTANVLKAIHEFATAAGLTLRAQKAGRSPNTTAG